MQPLDPQWMTRGGSSCSSTLRSSVRPSVSSACRVSSESLEGSLDHAVLLISTTIRATWSPRVSSQSQPRASVRPGRAWGPRFALIVQVTKRDYEMPADRRLGRIEQPRSTGSPSEDTFAPAAKPGSTTASESRFRISRRASRCGSSPAAPGRRRPSRRQPTSSPSSHSASARRVAPVDDDRAI
jgi:hypothetical protein